MTTYNGDNENLRFRCKDCGYGTTLDVEPKNEEDMKKLANWLLTHSANGGDYINIPVNKTLSDEIEGCMIHQDKVSIALNDFINKIFTKYERDAKKSVAQEIFGKRLIRD